MLITLLHSAPGGAPRKCVKSKLFDAALKDLGLIDIKQLLGKEILHTYFLDVIALMRVLPRNSETVREFAWRILKSMPQQYSIIFLVCDSYKDHSIKNKERLERGTGMKYVLKSPGMQMPSDSSIFMKNGENKTILLNLIEQVYIEDYEKLQDKIVYFSNAHHC